MAKNLVECCDGTWNDPDELRDHVAKPTNVAELALALVSDVDKPVGEQIQLMRYEPGVGTSPDAILPRAISKAPVAPVHDLSAERTETG